jgi:hypothetical protein
MLIMPDSKLIEKVPPELANFLISLLYLGSQRNKIMLPYSWLKQSMLQSGVVLHNFYRCNKFLRTMATL